ncbi:ABC transporter permease [Chitinophaga cymbidii]|uniref:ABC transporter permease n=1 Tax=Chitinophaga cymbidii TaxID=1096750 RepID=A0A512RDK1_9BACT|nr:ABC transporter permease [Chitinophaga cymbidii]GEP93785.1 ABC transporter permease [Chitinophaga cymbidii]
MLKNYFLIAWRTIRQNKTLSFINIFGLSTGMAFALLIGLWVKHETSFNKFNEHAERIGIMRKNTQFNNEKATQVATPLPLHDELKNNYPEVERATRMDWGNGHSLMHGDSKYSKRGRYVDPDFLKMSSLPLLQGNIETALNDPNSIILSQSLAATMFRGQNPLGKIVRIDNQYNVQVTGVIADAPSNFSFGYEFLAPFEFKVLNIDFVKNAKTQWSNNFLMNLVELKEGASMEAFSKKIERLIEQKDENNKGQRLFLQPLLRWHLYNDYRNWASVGGKIEYVRLLGIVGILVLLIACINFMNLSTARSGKRAREVGVRKAIGSQRSQLIVQFLTESMLTAFIAFLLALVLMWVVLPFLKDVGFEAIRINFSDLSLLASVLGVCILTGLIAGSYPALYLSSFLPVKVLKGTLRQGTGAAAFRKVLVVSQFAVSVGLIISTVIVFQQIRHAKERSVGYDPDNLITISASTDLIKQYAMLKQDLLNTGFLEAVSKSSSPMTGVNNNWGGFSWEGYDPSANIAMDVVMTEWDYEKTVGLRLKQGRAFSKEFRTDSSAVIINEAAMKVIGFKEPLGKIIRLNDQPLTIIGVNENVIMRDPFKSVVPTVIIFNPDNVSDILLRLKPGRDVRQALAAIQPVVERYNPSLPFAYNFVDEEYGKKFAMENQVGKLAGIFAVLAIFISCLGLFGLAMFMAERRTKEIGIRKVLGASLADVWMLLSKEFVWLVLAGCLIASPLAFWLMQNWLRHYDYRIDISWWIFILAGSLAVVIALLTVSTQAVKAAMLNPVKSLRSE